MDTRKSIKTKSSQLGEDCRAKFYKIRARLAKKQMRHFRLEPKDCLRKLPRTSSCSPRKMRGTLTDIFKDARKVRSCETYLISTTQNHPNNQEDYPSPSSKNSRHPKHFHSNTHLPRNRSFSRHDLKNSAASGKGDPHQAIEILVRKEDFTRRSKQDLMTSLSKIILGQGCDPTDYSFAILDESSILGDEQNYIDIDEMFLPEDMRAGTQKHSPIPAGRQ